MIIFKYSSRHVHCKTGSNHTLSGVPRCFWPDHWALEPVYYCVNRSTRCHSRRIASSSPFASMLLLNLPLSSRQLLIQTCRSFLPIRDKFLCGRREQFSHYSTLFVCLEPAQIAEETLTSVGILLDAVMIKIFCHRIEHVIASLTLVPHAFFK